MRGHIRLSRALTLPEFQYLTAFSESRRMRRNGRLEKDEHDPIRVRVGLPAGPEGGYVVHSDETRSLVLDHNSPPEGQPALWCFWRPSADGLELVFSKDAEDDWTWGSGDWLAYIAEHFLAVWGIKAEGRVWSLDSEGATLVIARDNVVYQPAVKMAYIDPTSGEVMFIEAEDDEDE